MHRILTSLFIFTCFFTASVVCTHHVHAETRAAPQTHSTTTSDKNGTNKKTAIIPFEDESPLLAVRKRKKTSALQIAGIFHRHAKTEPDFRTWAENNPKYLDALEIDKKEVFTTVYNRLVRAFNEIDKDMMINVQTRMPLGEYSELQSIQVMDMIHEKTFFRYDAYGEYFALIPNDIKRFHHLRMDPMRYKAFKEANGKRNDIIVELHLKIQKVDSTQPHELENGKKFWLMLGDIAELRFWSLSKDNPKLLWRYQADWYDGYVDIELMKLFSGQADAITQ